MRTKPDSLEKLKTNGPNMSPDDIVDSYTIGDIKRYIGFLHVQLAEKNKGIKQLIQDNTRLEMELDLAQA